MRRSLAGLGLVAAVTALAGCSTLGQPVTLNLAELTTRCEYRGGTLTPTGAQTGRAQFDFICREPAVWTLGHGEQARVSLNQAIDRSLRRGQ